MRVSVWEPAAAPDAHAAGGPGGPGGPDRAGLAGAAPASTAPPLVLLSHGTGGSLARFEWLAGELRRRGALVVGVEHHGNTLVEPYLPEGFSMVWHRPLDVTFALDWTLREYDVDSERITAAGFSLGGYTVAALAGARLNREALALVLTGAIPTPPLPEFPDLVDQLLARYGVDRFRALVAAAPASVRDGRVRRIAMLAPAIGPLVDPDSLADVTVPALVLWGDADDIAEPAINGRFYAAGIPEAVGRTLGPVDHWVFLDDPAAADSAPGDLIARARARASADVADFLLGSAAVPARA